jgi:hypothetical protein
MTVDDLVRLLYQQYRDDDDTLAHRAAWEIEQLQEQKANLLAEIAGYGQLLKAHGIELAVPVKEGK